MSCYCCMCCCCCCASCCCCSCCCLVSWPACLLRVVLALSTICHVLAAMCWWAWQRTNRLVPQKGAQLWAWPSLKLPFSLHNRVRIFTYSIRTFAAHFRVIPPSSPLSFSRPLPYFPFHYFCIFATYFFQQFSK